MRWSVRLTPLVVASLAMIAFAGVVRAHASTWVVTPSPNVAGRNSSLAAVAVVPHTNRAWAVGTAALPSDNTTAETLIERWSGSSWHITRSPNVDQGDELDAVSVNSRSVAWAVGDYLDIDTSQPLALHWDGTTWAVTPVAEVPTSGGTLYGVAGLSSDDMWAVGVTGPLGFGPPEFAALLYHWDGSTWTQQTVPLPANTVSSGIVGIWRVPGTSTLVAVGDGNVEGADDSFIWTNSGSGWTLADGPSGTIGAFGGGIQGIGGESATDLWAFGLSDSNSSPFLAHYDGVSWTQVPEPLPEHADPSGSGFSAITSVPGLASSLWAVGGYSKRNGFSQYLIEHWGGRRWNIVDGPTVPGDFVGLLSVAASSWQDIWAVGATSTDTTNPATTTLIMHLG